MVTNLFSNPWHRSRIIAFDTETTGIDVNTDRVVTATIATIEGRDTQVTSWLINPGVPIPAEASAVHGVTTEHAQEHGTDPATAITEIAAALTQAATDRTPVIAYNAGYDFTILDRECRRHQLRMTLPLIVDPFVIDKECDRFRKGKRTLSAACDHYGVLLGEAHNATDDALAAARVAWVLAERFPDRVQVDLEQLHRAQVEWKREQVESFGRYLVKQGKADDVAREWPFQSPPKGWSAVGASEAGAA